ncbi:MAG: hypothetical protein WC141_10780 [Arcobacteraceae bacterium]
MKKLFVLTLILSLFAGCGKNEPILPKSYENISFNELMETMKLKKTYSDNVSTIYKSEILDSAKYRRNDFYDYNEPLLDYCKSKNGKFVKLYDFSTKTFKHYIEYEKESTHYCKKDNDILFVTYKNSYHKPWQKYPRYIYYFVESNVLTDEIKDFILKKEKEEFIKFENKKIKLNNKIQLAQNKVKTIDIKIQSIMDNSFQNSNLNTYKKNSFKDIDGVYYFNVMNKIEKWDTTKIRLNFDGFYIFKDVENLTENFTNKVLNTISTDYRFKVKPYKNKNLISTSSFDSNNMFNINRDLNLSKVDVIVGFKQIINPDIVRKCNDSQLINAFTTNPDSIKNIIGAHCSQVYSYDSVLYNIIIYDHKTKQIVFYAVNE